MSLMLPIVGRHRQLPARRTDRSARFRFRPAVDGMEDRVVMAASVGSHLAAAVAAPTAAPAIPLLTNLIDQVVVQSGQLVGQIIAGGQTTNVPLTLTSPGTNILHLQINSIDLNLLGLEVKTSPICLNITTTPGSLLGNLVTALGSPGGLSGFLSGLSKTNLTSLTSTLTDLLNGALGAVTSTTPTMSGPSSSILHLSLGPVNLNLLGLNVALDNCATPAGPVTVDIIAHKNGGLLGNLLFGLGGVLNTGNASNQALTNQLNHVAGALQAALA